MMYLQFCRACQTCTRAFSPERSALFFYSAHLKRWLLQLWLQCGRKSLDRVQRNKCTQTLKVSYWNCPGSNTLMDRKVSPGTKRLWLLYYCTACSPGGFNTRCTIYLFYKLHALQTPKLNLACGRYADPFILLWGQKTFIVTNAVKRSWFGWLRESLTNE